MARRVLQVALDACLVALAFLLAFVLRFDPRIPARYDELLGQSIAFVVAGKLFVFWGFGLYHKLWRFTDGKDFEAIVRAVVVASFALVVAFFLIPPRVALDPPRGVIALDFLLTLTLVGGARFLVRAVMERRFRGPLARKGAREVLIVGAGNGGQLVAAELRRNPELGGVPIGFVDDDPRKAGVRIAGLKVEGTTDDLARVLDGAEPDEVIIAIPSAPGELRQKVVTACRERGHPRAHPADGVRAALGRPQPDAPGARGAGRGRARPRPDAPRDRPRGRLPGRRGRAGDRRRRLDRLRAVPPDLAREPQAARAARQRGEQPVRDPPRARVRPPLHPHRRRARRHQGRHADARDLRRAPPRGGVPRRRLQARAADGGEPRSRPCATTRWPRASWPRPRARPA